MPAKRKIPSMGLERRVKPRKEDRWDPEPDISGESSEEDDDDAALEEDVHNSRSRQSHHKSSQNSTSEESRSESGSDSGSDSDIDDEDPSSKVDVSSISFGALARAQATLNKQKSSKDAAKTDQSSQEKHSEKPYPTKKDTRNVKRSSKHAPQEQSSKRPVSRKRAVVPEDGKRAAPRDPRFDPMITARGSRTITSGSAAAAADSSKMAKNYAFLDDYRASELADLKIQAKKAKDPSTREDLKRQIHSIESRQKALARKEEAEKVLREHRKKEKEMVAMGKTPFYLKKSEQKKQVLVNQYSGMSKGAVDRAIERKRKKIAGKEKKEMGFLEGRVTNRAQGFSRK